MAQEAIFYFDVLGFAEMDVDDAIAALGDLAAMLAGVRDRKPNWAGRYALSDSVFLTHPDPAWAVAEAAEVVTNLLLFTRNDPRPLLVRGAIAYGDVQHVLSVFLSTREAANVVGRGVVEAVRLAERSGLKGPRLLLSDAAILTVRERDTALADWLMRPTAAAGAWEVLWILPHEPARLPGDEEAIFDLCRLSLDLLGRYGGHPIYGEHYREFVLLAARSLQRIHQYSAASVFRRQIREFLPPEVVRRVVDQTSGLPDSYITTVMGVLETLR